MTEACPDILCFLLVDMMDEPCRIQVYCRSGTVGTCRVLNGEVREIFQRKCTLRQVHEIFHQPMLLPNVDPETFGHPDEEDEDEEREPKNQHHYGSNHDNGKQLNRESLLRDEQMVDIGLSILASEFDGLMSNFKSILNSKQKQEENEHELQQQYVQQQQHMQMMQMKQQQQQEHVDIQMMEHKQRMQFQQQQVRMKNVQQGNSNGAPLTPSKKVQQLRKKQMQQQVHQIRQNQLRQTANK